MFLASHSYKLESSELVYQHVVLGNRDCLIVMCEFHDHSLPHNHSLKVFVDINVANAYDVNRTKLAGMHIIRRRLSNTLIERKVNKDSSYRSYVPGNSEKFVKQKRGSEKCETCPSLWGVNKLYECMYESLHNHLPYTYTILKLWSF